jgi:hypothetical protein
MHTYKGVEIPHVSPANMNSWNAEYLRWLELRPIRHLLVVEENPQRCSRHERVHNIPNDMPYNQRVPGHTWRRHDWEERDSTGA